MDQSNEKKFKSLKDGVCSFGDIWGQHCCLQLSLRFKLKIKLLFLYFLDSQMHIVLFYSFSIYAIHLTISYIILHNGPLTSF